MGRSQLLKEVWPTTPQPIDRRKYALFLSFPCGCANQSRIRSDFDATATLAGLPMPSEIFEDQDITELEMETGEALLKRWEVVKQRSSQGAKSTASDATTASTLLQAKDTREPKPESVVDGKIEEPSGEERPVLHSLGAGTGAGDRSWPDSEPAPSLQEDSPIGVTDAASTTSHSSSFLQDASRYTHTGFVCSRCSVSGILLTKGTNPMLILSVSGRTYWYHARLHSRNLQVRAVYSM